MLTHLAVLEELRQGSTGQGAGLQPAPTLMQTAGGDFQPGLQFKQRLLLAQGIDPLL